MVVTLSGQFAIEKTLAIPKPRASDYTYEAYTNDLFKKTLENPYAQKKQVFFDTAQKPSALTSVKVQLEQFSNLQSLAVDDLSQKL